MLVTKITKLLGIKHPIIQAAMAWVTSAEMAAAVSNAGGLGTLGPNAGQKTLTRDPIETAERLRKEIKKTKKLTDKPFAVNVIVPSNPVEAEFSNKCLEVVLEEKVPVAIVSQGSPDVYTRKLKEEKIIVMHVIAKPRHAEKAEKAGVDAVITSGMEGGGHTGFDQLTTFVLVPLIADTVDIPIVAGGGVANGLGLAAALALGANAVYMGTRFLATKECPAHLNMKKAIVEAKATDTISIRHGLLPFEKIRDVASEMRRGAVRVLINDYVKKYIQMERECESPETLLAYLFSPAPNRNISRFMAAAIYGDLVEGAVGAGQEVELIKDIPTIKELVERIVGEAEEVISKLSEKKM